MTHKKDFLYIFNEDSNEYEKYPIPRQRTISPIIFIILLIVLLGVFTHIFIWDANWSANILNLSIVGKSVMWILIFICILILLICYSYTRRNSIEYAKYLGYSEDKFEKMEDFERFIVQKLKSEHKLKNSNEEFDLHEENKRKFEEFKKLKKTGMLNRINNNLNDDDFQQDNIEKILNSSFGVNNKDEF